MLNDAARLPLKFMLVFLIRAELRLISLKSAGSNWERARVASPTFYANPRTGEVMTAHRALLAANTARHGPIPDIALISRNSAFILSASDMIPDYGLIPLLGKTDESQTHDIGQLPFRSRFYIALQFEEFFAYASLGF